MSNIVKKWVMRVQGLDRYVAKNDTVKDEFELLSFSHGIFAHGVAPDGSRHVQMQDVNLARYSDAATPIFFKLCQSGDVLDSVIIDLRSYEDERENFVMRYELLKARVSNVAPGGGSGGPDGLVEGLSLSCERLRMHVKNGGTHSTVDIVPPKP